MPNELLRRRYARFRNKSLWAVVSCFLIGLFVIGVCALAWGATNDNLLRVSYIAWMVWAVYFMWQGWRRGWPGALPPGTEPAACAAFYRTELLRKTAYFRDIGKWFLLPALGCAVFTLTPAILKGHIQPIMVKRSLPFLTLMAVWLILFGRMRKREERELQLEIDTLDAFRRGE